jgi:hypothetical protein
VPAHPPRAGRVASLRCQPPRRFPQLRHISMPEGAGGTCAQGPRAGPGLPPAVGTAWGMPQASAPVPACPDGATPRSPQTPRPAHIQPLHAAPRTSRASRRRCHVPLPIPHAGSHPMGAVVARSREGAHARARANFTAPPPPYRNLRITWISGEHQRTRTEFTSIISQLQIDSNCLDQSVILFSF